MIRFLKVSEAQWLNDCRSVGFETDSNEMAVAFQNLSMPARATGGSAGYDFVSPLQVVLEPGESCAIPTGIRVIMPENVVLLILPRSGLGVRYRMQLANTVGVIDSDYAHAENEGHIIIHLTNDNRTQKTLTIRTGERFVQGIFIPFLCTADDNAYAIRSGGFGSTGFDEKVKK